MSCCSCSCLLRLRGWGPVGETVVCKRFHARYLRRQQVLSRASACVKFSGRFLRARSHIFEREHWKVDSLAKAEEVPFVLPLTFHRTNCILIREKLMPPGKIVISLTTQNARFLVLNGRSWSLGCLNPGAAIGLRRFCLCNTKARMYLERWPTASSLVFYIGEKRRREDMHKDRKPVSS